MSRPVAYVLLQSFLLLNVLFASALGTRPISPALHRKHASAHDVSKDGIDAAVGKAGKALMSNPQMVGLSVGIYKDGKTYTYNYGEVEKGKRQPPTHDTLYAIASITKTFTGTLLAQAAVEKKLRLDDDVRKYLDGNYPNLEYQGEPIRLFHLINHRAGLPFLLPDEPQYLPGYDNQPPAAWLVRIRELYKHYTKNDFYNDLHRVKLEAVPGTKFQYSNAGAQLAGYILERLYGMSYEEIVRSKILKPLKMNSTKIMLTESERRRAAKGYDDQGSVMSDYVPDQLQAAGALKSTAADMLNYVRWQLEEKDKAVKLSHQPTWSDGNGYSTGLNWQMLKSSENRVIWQEGNTPGFNSYCVIYPELNIGIVVLTNESDRFSSPRLSLLVNQIIKRIDARAVALPGG
jgi:D-alanyl-D-alanine-carboxypeptidase/D-alanyl-D-alanine-endopeptidase